MIQSLTDLQKELIDELRAAGLFNHAMQTEAVWKLGRTSNLPHGPGALVDEAFISRWKEANAQVKKCDLAHASQCAGPLYMATNRENNYRCERHILLQSVWVDRPNQKVDLVPWLKSLKPRQTRLLAERATERPGFRWEPWEKVPNT